MIFYSMKCPHCHTENVAAELIDSVQKSTDPEVWVTFGICQYCHSGVCIEFESMYAEGALPHNCTTLCTSYSVVKIYPKNLDNKCPKYCPDNIVSFYMQAVDCLQRKNFDASGMMFRKTLDIATKSLGANPSKKLKSRIDELKNNQKITFDMAEWAHQIRIDGNDAAHEDELFTQEAAEALKDFTELLLMYTFTLPGMLAERKAALVSSSIEESK